ncbi:MAG: FkbM family methyltransferase [Gemmatimonadetes bacterium]|nr:FkbM family methyltransferase [Gemmatimonadota bacterium]
MRLPHALRNPGARVLRHIPLRIRSGPNRGLKWSLASSGRGYRTGRFESGRIQALRSLVSHGDRVWDIGAHKGYVSMALSRSVGEEGSVTAFEPSQENLWFLRKHIEWNALTNVRIFPVAVSDVDGSGRFGGRGSSVTFRLGQGSESVRVATLRILAKEEGLSPPDVLKIDVEGNEGAVLRGAGDLLTDEMLLFISVHSRSAYDKCRDLLLARRYRLHESVELAKRLADPASHWGADHELIAVGDGRRASEGVVRSLPLFAV